MKKQLFKTKFLPATLKMSALSLAVSSAVAAQMVSAQETDEPAPVMEEVLILGRMKAAAFDVVAERMDLDVAADLVDAEQISRVGDSTVAGALRRMPGVTLVNGKFVYVRGLGERYSSTTLNGAVVPSPDLSRNVIPLDIFPTSIVSSLSVQKVASSDMPAAFGGGSIDIRTRSIPEDLTFSVELGTKLNTESRADALAYAGGPDDHLGKDDGTRAISPTLLNALDTYLGDLDALTISETDNITLDQAEGVNRQLLTELNRNITIYNDNTPQTDFSGALTGGNLWVFDNDIEFGVLAGVDYERTTRSKETIKRVSGMGDIAFTTENETTYNTSITGDLSFGLRLNENHSIETTSLFIRNTDDNVSTAKILNSNRTLPDGSGFKEYGLRYEAREMQIHQIHGKHEITVDTLEDLKLGFLDFADGLKFNWYYSDAESTTDIPNELTVTSDTTVDTTSADVLSERVQTSTSAADYRFTDLEDYVESYGWHAEMPLEMSDFYVTVSGGYEYWEKARIYRQLQMYIDTSETPHSALYGPTGSVFSNTAALNPANEMQISVAADNEDSYIAANKVLATYGKVNFNWDDVLKVTGGIRWEDYQQVNLPWNPLDYSGSQLLPIRYDNPQQVANYFENATYTDDEAYGSLAFVYIRPSFWAEDFQLRGSYTQTTVRPDLREISSGSFLDPITDILVFGNPDVIPTTLDNVDVRAEWFFSNGDNLTASVFFKDLDNPIEMYQVAASDDNIATEVINAQSGTVTGLELEFVKNLASVSDVLSPFFVQGNMTFLDTEIIAGDKADAVTNEIRPMSGASEKSGNLIFGFDSSNEQHAATLSVNYFSERLYFGGRNGDQDAYEQPYTSLDFTYSYYPVDEITVKFKAQNLLDEAIEINQRGTSISGGTTEETILERNIGQTFSLNVKYQF